MRITIVIGLTLSALVPLGSPAAGTESGKHAVESAPARIEMTDDGSVWVTPSGMSLYTYATDDNTPGKSACSSVPVLTYHEEQSGLGVVPVIGADIQKSCSRKSPPYLADEGAVPVGDFALIERPEGGRQWTYRGHPLYLSSRDHKPGDHNGVAVPGIFGGGRFGFRLAAAPLNIPAGLKLLHRDGGLTLATQNDRPVYTSRGPRVIHACAGCDSDLFRTVQAPAIANVSGDWSIVDAGPGSRQYAFKGKPLFIAPDSLSDIDIEQTGQWQAVVYRKSPGIPADISTRFTLIGDVYTDNSGHTLYTFNCNSPARDGTRCDEPGDPAGYWVAMCGDPQECMGRWHPYLARANTRPVGLWSVVEITQPTFKENPGIIYPPDLPHVKVWAYRGTPVWTYYEDQQPGEIWGHWIKWIGGSSFSALQVPGREIPEN